MMDYNFFDIYNKKKGINIDPKSTTFVFLLILLLIILLTLGSLMWNLFLSYRISTFTNEIQTVKSTQEYIEADKLQTSMDAMGEYDKNAEIALNKFNKFNIINTTLISNFNALLPKTASINTLIVNYSTIQFGIKAPDRKVIAETILNLKNSGLFKNVESGTITRDMVGTGFQTSIDCILKEGVSK